MSEQWNDIKGFEGLYRISDMGRIISCARTLKMPRGMTRDVPEIVMKKFNHIRGYDIVFLSKDGKKTKHFVHRLVAEAFIPNPDNLPMVNHEHGDKKDNRVSELSWSTYSSNTQHFIRGSHRAENEVF